MTYVDGFVLPVPEKNIEAYRDMAEAASKIWLDHGALAYKECVMEDGTPSMEGAPEGMTFVTFPQLAGTKDGETVVFAFIVYESREHRDEVNAKVMADPRMKDACPDPDNMPMDCTRMTWGGFKALVDH